MNPVKKLDELSRRSFLANTANTAFGVTLGGAAASWFNSAEAAEAIAKSKGKAKHVVYLYMSGGMTHIDTFDPKPDAPEAYRGPIKAISTNVAGIQLGQHLEKTAKHLCEKFAQNSELDRDLLQRALWYMEEKEKERTDDERRKGGASGTEG